MTDDDESLTDQLQAVREELVKLRALLELRGEQIQALRADLLRLTSSVASRYLSERR